MTEEIFLKRKQDIIGLLQSMIDSHKGSDFELYSIKRVKEIINEYSYVKRIIIDSLELDYNLGEQIINFDSSIK
jgi:hypothetical protein